MRGHPLDRFEGIEVAEGGGPSLTEEVLAGLRRRPQARLPAKLLYDGRGCELFDRICGLPEYYPTRTEYALLARTAEDIAARSECCELVELGSGLARKSHLLLDALTARHPEVRYVPFDVSEWAIRGSAERMLRRYPRLRLRGVVGDFTRDLLALPTGRRRLIALLGSTIGNLDTEELTRLVTDVSRQMEPGDHFLVAADLVKHRRLLSDAYNDAQGVTAAFNLNALRRLRVELGFNVCEGAFRHDAFFDEPTSRIEIHARAWYPTLIEASAFGFRHHLDAGESVRTEISRKFQLADIDGFLKAGGLEPVEMYTDDPGYALALARLR